jgi:hypothetical protein
MQETLVLRVQLKSVPWNSEQAITHAKKAAVR